MAVAVTWMSFASGVRELRGDILSMLETHIVMSFLSFYLILTLVLRLTLFHVLFPQFSHGLNYYSYSFGS
jgi:hypothetical protein